MLPFPALLFPMNKTLYIKPGEEETWDMAKRISELRQSNISAVVMDALRCYVSRNMGIAEQIESLLKELAEKDKA